MKYSRSPVPADFSFKYLYGRNLYADWSQPVEGTETLIMQNQTEGRKMDPEFDVED